MALALGALSGCVTPETAVEEGVWLTLQSIDAAQTVNFAASGRVHESESAWAMGREPSRGSVYAYMGGMAVLHTSVALYMDANDFPRWSRRLFEAVTISDSVMCVRGNYRLGIAAHF